MICQGLIKALPNNKIEIFYQSLPSELIFITINFSEDIKPLESGKFYDIVSDGVRACFKDNFLFSFFFNSSFGNSRWRLQAVNRVFFRSTINGQENEAITRIIAVSYFSFRNLLKKISTSTLYHVRDGFEINKILRNSIHDRKRGIFSELDSRSFLKVRN